MSVYLLAIIDNGINLDRRVDVDYLIDLLVISLGRFDHLLCSFDQICTTFIFICTTSKVTQNLLFTIFY